MVLAMLFREGKGKLMKVVKGIIHFIMLLVFTLSIVTMLSIFRLGFKTPDTEDVYIPPEYYYFVFYGCLLLTILIFAVYSCIVWKKLNAKDSSCFNF